MHVRKLMHDRKYSVTYKYHPILSLSFMWIFIFFYKKVVVLIILSEGKLNSLRSVEICFYNNAK